LRIVEGANTGGGQGIVPTRTATANRRARRKPGSREPFGLETVKSRVDRASRDIALQARLDFIQNRSAVGVLRKPYQSEQYRLLKLANHVCHLCLQCRH